MLYHPVLCVLPACPSAIITCQQVPSFFCEGHARISVCLSGLARRFVTLTVSLSIGLNIQEVWRTSGAVDLACTCMSLVLARNDALPSTACLSVDALCSPRSIAYAVLVLCSIEMGVSMSFMLSGLPTQSEVLGTGERKFCDADDVHAASVHLVQTSEVTIHVPQTSSFGSFGYHTFSRGTNISK